MNCAFCHTALPLTARVCPLCGTARPDDVPDELQTRAVSTRRVKMFPRWLYRAGVGALMMAVLLLVGTFAGLAALSVVLLGVNGLLWMWILMGLSGLFGAMILLVAQFGPWPLEE